MLGELIHDGDEHAIDEEAAGGELHDRDGIEQIGGEGDAAPGTAAEDLTHGGHAEQSEGEAQAHAQTIEGGINDIILAGKHLGTAEDDAVYHDKRQEDAEALVEALHIGLEQQLHHRNKAGDDDDEAGNANLIGDDIAQQGDNDIGAQQYKGGRQTHAQRIEDRGGGSDGGAGAQHQNQNGVLLDDTIGEGFQLVTHLVPHAPFTVSKAAKASLTASL